MLGFRKGNQAAAGMGRDYGWDNVMLSLSQKEAFDLVKSILETKTPFSIVGEDTVSPKRITAYGGRGMGKGKKAVAGMMTLGVGAALNHYASEKRYLKFFFKNAVGNQTLFRSTFEGYTADTFSKDRKMSGAFNKVHDALEEYVVDMSAETDLREIKQKYAAGIISKEEYKVATGQSDPMKVLEERLAKGEITREEYEDMKEALES